MSHKNVCLQSYEVFSEITVIKGVLFIFWCGFSVFMQSRVCIFLTKSWPGGVFLVILQAAKTPNIQTKAA